MSSRTKTEHEVLNPERSEEMQQLLQALSGVGQVTVSLSPIAFAAVCTEITPEETPIIFDNDCLEA